MKYKCVVLLPHIILIFFVPWILLPIQIYSIPWMADREVESILMRSGKSFNANMQDSINRKLKDKFQNEYKDNIGRLFDLKKESESNQNVDKFQVDYLYDLLSQQVRTIGFKCPTLSSLKKLYCEKKKEQGFVTGMEHIHCENELIPSSIVYSYQSSEFSYSDSGDIFINYENEDLILDDPNCLSVVIDGDVLICGDLTVANGQLNTLTSFDASETFNLSLNQTQSKHFMKRCIIRKGLTVRGSLILPFSSLFVIGKLTVGKNVYAADLQVDLSSNFFVGLLYLFSELHQKADESNKWTPFTITRMRLLHESNTCLSSFNNTIVDDQYETKYLDTGDEITEHNMGSLWSGRKIYIGNNAKLWVRGDIAAGEISIADGGILYNTCGNLKTNTTHGLGIHIRDSGRLYMINSSIETIRLSVIRSSKVSVKHGEILINNVLLLHTSSSIYSAGNLLFKMGLVRDSSLLHANTLIINNGIKLEGSGQLYRNREFTEIYDFMNTTYNYTNNTQDTNFTGYFQIISTSTVIVDENFYINGCLEVNEGSEFISMGYLSIRENMIINDGSEIYALGKVGDLYNQEKEDIKLLCSNYSHCIMGSTLISNSSSLLTVSSNLYIYKHLDLINGRMLLGGSLHIGKTFISTSRSKIYIRSGDLVIFNKKDHRDVNEREKQSLFLSDSVMLVNGNIIIESGDANLIMKSYMEIQRNTIIKEGNLGISTKSAFRIAGYSLNDKNILYNRVNDNSNNLMINGNLTLNNYSDLMIDDGIIDTKNIILTSNSKIRTSENELISQKELKMHINGVLVLQGHSYFILLKGYLLEIREGVMIDESSLLYTERLKLTGDIFVDDSGMLFGDSLLLFGPSTIVSQDSSKIYIQNLTINYLEKEKNNVKNFTDIYKDPIYISENGGSIKIQNCRYICNKLDCVKKLFGIRTRESTITIKQSYPWFIPIKFSMQYYERNSSEKFRESNEVIDPIAFIYRNNPEKTEKFESKSKILFNKGEQVRRGRNWGTESAIYAVNGSQTIQWQ